MFCDFDVTPGPPRDVFLFLASERASDFCRGTKNQRARRNFLAEGDQYVRADDGARADFRAVENDCAHADKDFVMDSAGVDDRTVSDRDQIANESWEDCDRHGRRRYPEGSPMTVTPGTTNAVA
jgi:hypothetical protein